MPPALVPSTVTCGAAGPRARPHPRPAGSGWGGGYSKALCAAAPSLRGTPGRGRGRAVRWGLSCPGICQGPRGATVSRGDRTSVVRE